MHLLKILMTFQVNNNRNKSISGGRDLWIFLKIPLVLIFKHQQLFKITAFLNVLFFSEHHVSWFTDLPAKLKRFG